MQGLHQVAQKLTIIGWPSFFNVAASKRLALEVLNFGVWKTLAESAPK